jgi:hypothetical protein
MKINKEPTYLEGKGMLASEEAATWMKSVLEVEQVESE